ncbi:unnamed protein product [Sphagnum balticum]
MAVLAVVCGRDVRLIGLVLLLSMFLAMTSPLASAARDDGRKLRGKEASSTYRLVAGTLSTGSFFPYSALADASSWIRLGIHHHPDNDALSGTAVLSRNTCATDFSTVSFANVKSACPVGADSPSASCCTAYTDVACQYSAEVNDFNSICPIMFINYLSAAGPYPAGYFVGNCVSGTNGLCPGA